LKNLLKRLYNSIPFKKQIFTALKLVYTPNESVYKYLHFKDVIDITMNSNARFKMHHYGYQIENEIFWKGLDGGWEKNSVNLWVQLVKNSHTIIDIGANTGIFALISKAVNPAANVYAFEPIERIHKKLEENISLNNFDIHGYAIAMSDKNGKAEILDDPTKENEYSLSLNDKLNPYSADLIKIDIDIITLDSFIEKNDIKGIDLIKIDVETHEGEVMEGFMKYLPVFKPTFLIEILRNEVGEKVQNCVAGLGYLYFNIDENGDIVKVDQITRRGHNYNYLLCSAQVANELDLNFS